jgi:Protein of unknown function (DUF2808)
MNKKLVSIAALFLVTGLSNISNSAKAIDSASPHVDSKFEFPNHRWAPVSQTIRVHIPSNSPALENLLIDVPENFKFQVSKIEITDRDGIVNAPIDRQGQRLKIRFDRPIAAGTNLNISFNGVERNMQARSSTYYLYGTTNGTSSFLGEAYFPRQ